MSAPTRTNHHRRLPAICFICGRRQFDCDSVVPLRCVTPAARRSNRRASRYGGTGSGVIYLVNIGLEDVGGVAAGERLNVSQMLKPDGRFAESNSP
jgi:hypothetical protein